MTDTKDRADVAPRPSIPASSGNIVVRFGDVLRRYREGQRLTQEKAAELAQVSRATFTQWESGRHLPSAQRIEHLDRMLEAGGELISAADATRSRPAVARPVPVAPERPVGPTFTQVLREAKQALLGQLVHQDGRPVGWRHNLVESAEPVSTLSTIFGLEVFARLSGPVSVGPLSPVVDRVLDLGRDEDGRLLGWQASTQVAPRMETTGIAIDSLLQAGVPFGVDEVLRVLGEQFDQTVRQRPFVLTLGLEPLLRVAPDSELTAGVVQALLDCRVERDGALLWPEKHLSREQPMLDVSLAHTARAVTVLRNAPGRLVSDAVTEAEEWIAEQTNLDGVTEIVRRSLGERGREETAFRHFTSAQVIRALSGSDRPATRTIARALDVLWERYDPAHHTWAWGNGDVPVWMLFDAVAALHESALALSTAPLRPDDQTPAAIPHQN